MKTTHSWIAALIALACPGCLTVSARVHGGPTLSTDGKIGWEVRVAAGLGYSMSPRTSIRSLPQVATGDRGTGFGTSLEVGRLDPRIGWHAGIAAELATTEDEGTRSVYGAALHPLLFAHRNASGEKFTVSSEMTRALQVGIEARAGLALTTDNDARGVFALTPVLDWTMTLAD